MPARRRADRGEPPDRRSPLSAGELRDTERVIALWRQKAAELGRPPPAAAFDFAPLAGERGCRFILCGDSVVEDATFLAYGTQFARLFELPEKPVIEIPALRQLPGRYQPMFAEGYSAAIVRGEPARFSGAVMHYGMVELYRAAFMPLKLKPQAAVQLVFGSFNFRSGLRAAAVDTFQATANWLREDLSIDAISDSPILPSASDISK